MPLRDIIIDYLNDEKNDETKVKNSYDHFIDDMIIIYSLTG
jgi:hypothetical protein